MSRIKVVFSDACTDVLQYLGSLDETQWRTRYSIGEQIAPPDAPGADFTIGNALVTLHECLLVERRTFQHGDGSWWRITDEGRALVATAVQSLANERGEQLVTEETETAQRVDVQALYDFVWDQVAQRRDSIQTGQDARNVMEDERVLATHGGPDPDCSLCMGRLPERVCHACAHVAANSCEWLRSIARRHMTGTERRCDAPNSDCVCLLIEGHQGDHRCDHGPFPATHADAEPGAS